LTEYVPVFIASLVALGMAAAFYGADRQSPISRVIALAFAATGVSYGLGVPVGDLELARGGPYWGSALLGLVETVSLLAFAEWILRVRRTIPAGGFDPRMGDLSLRFAQLAALFYGAVGLLAPEAKQRDFVGGLQHADALTRPGFWLFAVPILLVLAAAGVGLLLLLLRRPERPEIKRVLAAIFSGPFMLGTFVLGHAAGAITMAIGEMIFLAGAVQYHVQQGHRGEFLSRFLSPQVARLVSERGLGGAIQHRQAEITIVCCDLRGFTAYARQRPSGEVIELLREYYDAAGQAAAECGATIKDFAGDGVLLLVGAPVPQADHAAQGLELARRLRDSVGQLTKRWCRDGERLGVGLGVASGLVTVGVIDSTSRMEYTAVGAAVNLASRLCERAADGEILADEHTVKLTAAADFKPQAAVELQGFVGVMALFASQA
jgi:class 3 adenylate cyclase